MQTKNLHKTAHINGTEKAAVFHDCGFFSALHIKAFVRFSVHFFNEYQYMACGAAYTPEPKKRAYSEEIRSLAIKIYYSGVSGRGAGKVWGMSKANGYRWTKESHFAWG